MKIKELRKIAFKKYKSHRLNSWILATICALFIAAITLISIVSEALVIIFIPFVILPFFFACTLLHSYLAKEDELSFSNLFSYYRMFYANPFRSSFSVIRSLLKSIIVELVLGFAATGIVYAIYSQSETFMITINQILESISDMSITTEQLQSLLEANNNELANFVDLTNSLNFLIFSFSFIFFILKEQITIYVRLAIRMVPLAHQIARESIKKNSKEFHKNYFALNWPMLVLILLGMVGGCFLAIFVFNKYSLCGPLGLSIGIALTLFYLPFYFANQETIFENLKIDISSISEEYLKKVFERFGAEVKITEHDTEEVDGVRKDSDDTESK